MCSIEQATPLEDLEREICELSAHIAAAMCRFLILLAEWDERGGWCDWGCRSCAQWLSWRCSITPGAARERMRVAPRLVELPLVREAFAAGELSYSKVRAVTRVATPKTEEQLVLLARHATGAQLEKLVRSYRGVLSATLDAARNSFDARRVTWHWEDDGSFSFRGRLTADEGALLLQAIDAARAQAPAYVDEQPPRQAATTADEASANGMEGPPAFVAPGPTADERDADALVAVARAALQHSEGARSGGDPCQLVVHVDADTLASDEVQVRSDLARSRDRGCRFPSCTHARFLHAHHIKHWAKGGETSIDNLVTLCSYHHRLVHESGFGVERAGPQGVRFRRPDGRIVPAVGASGRARGPGLVARQRAAGLRVDDRTCRAVSAGDPLDYSIAVEGLIMRELPDP
jgi:hypothetical protein